MTNKERYQRTFSALHASEDDIREVKAMKKTHQVYWKKLAAVCAAAVMVLALASGAYAADVGGIQRTVQIWLHGEQTDAVFTATGNGEYTLTYTDESGVEHESQGGGVALHHGHERPLTEEELLEDIDSARPEVDFADDGAVWLYYEDQKIELTDKFDEDGFCYYKLNDGERDMYLTIKYQRGMAVDYGGFKTPKSAFQD
ncbi:MAG: hypothetical protein IJV43_09675 [Oscillospiraceae bacterium]|nr:hypothetical protein [Oscillospiraceae bacterium]